MAQNVAQKLIQSHLVEGKMNPGEEIGLKIDQTLTQDATGTMVMLELEAMNLPEPKTELSVQYVDHNLLQTDFKNPDDHIFLRSACERFGLWYSRPGNGVSHPVHMENFGVPGKTLLGADSHTCAAGSLGMLAMGAGGLEVAMAIAGKPYHLNMPKILGVELTGTLPEWVSAKDVVLEMLRRFDVKGCVGKIIEYFGPGLADLSAMDRHVIANMGIEMGATASVFPADDKVRSFLKQQEREDDFKMLAADPGASYDETLTLNLSELVPLIALPSSPGKVVPVEEVAGKPIYQAVVGSSANPGFRDFAVVAEIIKDREVDPNVSLDINPASRQGLETLIQTGYLQKLVHAGARIHQAGCNGCIGMGQAPATGKNSLRTVPRNFPGRSGTREDAVFLCSPETAAASALTGKITDPRVLEMPYPKVSEPVTVVINKKMLVPPNGNGAKVKLEKGPNIKPLPDFEPLRETINGPVLLKVGDNVSTDEILPAGTRVLPFRSNIPGIAKFVFDQIDETYHDRALKHQKNGSIIVGGDNYGQGSSREHAAIAPRYLGVLAVIVKSFARIHSQNLVNFGILPVMFDNPEDYDKIDQGDVLSIPNVPDLIQKGSQLKVENETKGEAYPVHHNMSPRQMKALLAGGMINFMKHP